MTEKKTIAICGNQAFSLVMFRGDLARTLVQNGHTVYALAPEYDAEYEDKVRALGAVPIPVDLARTGTNPVHDLFSIKTLYRELKKIRPDAVLSYAIKPSIYGTLAAWLAGVPKRVAMIEGLGYIFIDDEKPSAAKKLLKSCVMTMFRFGLSKAHCVIFLNRDDQGDFERYGLVRKGDSMLLGGIGVDLDDWQASPPVTQPITFTYVGRMLADKGVREFYEAAQIVKAAYPDTRFILVGRPDGNPREIAVDELNSWVAAGTVEWAGHVPVKPWLKQTSVFVLPSYREGVPRSTQEAMAMAKPVITTNVPGCRETVVDGDNGYLVPARNGEALAEAMVRFVEQPDLITMMGKRSRQIAEQKFDVTKVNAKIIESLGLPRIEEAH